MNLNLRHAALKKVFFLSFTGLNSPNKRGHVSYTHFLLYYFLTFSNTHFELVRLISPCPALNLKQSIQSLSMFNIKIQELSYK
jgi:hypothetical protein